MSSIPNKLSFLIALILSVGIISCKNETAERLYNKGINITPKPMELTQNEGEFKLSDKTVFVSADDAVKKVADYFTAKLNKSTGYSLQTVSEKPSANYIELLIADDIDVNEEGYTLDATTNRVTIKAKTPQGIFYGMQTFMQLLPAEVESQNIVNGIAWVAPNVTIKDEPRFKHRGQHQDVCRHFMDVDFIKKQLDVLAMFKINKYHWHLTDDQGWRIESKKYPKLNEISTKRVEGEGNTYGPFYYTHEQIKEVVAYAKERFIDVIPEIELPGHGVAALAAYPELSCTGGPFEVRNIWGISNDVYCAGNDNTIQFLADVIEEAIPLFDSEYFHIGGDECPKGRWEKCPKCQARIKKEGLKDEHELQSWVVRQAEKVVLKHNKKMIGWDEILEGGLAPSATVMSWRGEKGGLEAASMGHDVIMCPGGWLYLDHYQGDSRVEPVAIGGYTSLEKTYSYEPIPAELSSDKAHHVLGAQGNLWAEYFYEPWQAEYHAFPRIIALAELTWTPKDKKDYKDFERRINNQYVRLDGRGTHYHIPIPEQVTPSCDFVAFTDTATIELKTVQPVKIVYTTDGQEPSQNSEEYKQPLKFSDNVTLKVRSVLPSGKMSVIRTIAVEKQDYAPAITTETTPGLKAEYYKGKHFKVTELEGKTPNETEVVEFPQRAKYRIPDYREVFEDDYWSTVLTGHFDIPENGIYYFSADVDEVWIDGKLAITNEGLIKKGTHADRSLALAKGKHAIKMVRLGNIIGGFPSQWENMYIRIREANEPQFKFMRKENFE